MSPATTLSLLILGVLGLTEAFLTAAHWQDKNDLHRLWGLPGFFLAVACLNLYAMKRSKSRE